METPEMQEQPAKPAPASFPKPVLSVEQWREAEKAFNAGMSYQDIAASFGVGYDAVRQRACRDEWLTPARIKAKHEELMAKEAAKVVNLSQPVTAGEERPQNALQALSTSLEGYRSQTVLGLAKLAKKGVERAIDANLTIENWQDAKIVADIAMKLHNVGQEGVQVNVLVGGDGGFDGPVVETQDMETCNDELDD